MHICQFAVLIQSFQVMTKTHSAYDTALHIRNILLFWALIECKSVGKVLSRYENVQEHNGIKEFSEREDIEDRSLDIFMQDIALLTNDDNDKTQDVLILFPWWPSIGKGLEFDNVFVVGLEENLFPSQMSLSSRTDLEEERRLFYVAITRAGKKLNLSRYIRYRWGTLTSCEPSRLLEEIDASFIELDFKPQQKKSDNPYGDEDRSPWRQKKCLWLLLNNTKNKLHFTKRHMYQVKALSPSDTSGLQVGMVEHERFGFGESNQHWRQ